MTITSNIAEGVARQTEREFVQFLYIAHGSLMEVDTQLLIAVDLKFLEVEDFEELIKTREEIGKMLHGLINFVKKRFN